MKTDHLTSGSNHCQERSFAATGECVVNTVFLLFVAMLLVAVGGAVFIQRRTRRRRREANRGHRIDLLKGRSSSRKTADPNAGVGDG
jgi:hypothetical protein